MLNLTRKYKYNYNDYQKIFITLGGRSSPTFPPFSNPFRGLLASCSIYLLDNPARWTRLLPLPSFLYTFIPTSAGAFMGVLLLLVISIMILDGFIPPTILIVFISYWSRVILTSSTNILIFLRTAFDEIC